MLVTLVFGQRDDSAPEMCEGVFYLALAATRGKKYRSNGDRWTYSSTRSPPPGRCLQGMQKVGSRRFEGKSVNLDSPDWLSGSLTLPHSPVPSYQVVLWTESSSQSWCAFSPKRSEGGRSSFPASSEEELGSPCLECPLLGPEGGESRERKQQLSLL